MLASVFTSVAVVAEGVTKEALAVCVLSGLVCRDEGRRRVRLCSPPDL